MDLLQHLNRRASRSSKFLLLVTSSVLLGSTPLLIPTAVYAQTISNTHSPIQATSAQDETLYLNSDRSYTYNLEVSNDLRIGSLNIPAGSIIRGRYEPADGGLRYVANAAEINGRTYNLKATSDVIEDVKDPRDTSVGAIAGDAGIGAAGGLVLGEIFGDAEIEEVVGGAVAGGIVGNVTADRVVVIKPDQPITLYRR